MGSITITIIGDASVLTKTKTFTVSDADINRTIAYLKVQANSVVNGTATTAQACLVWANKVLGDLQAGTVAFENAAALAAVAPPAPVVAT